MGDKPIPKPLSAARTAPEAWVGRDTHSCWKCSLLDEKVDPVWQSPGLGLPDGEGVNPWTGTGFFVFRLFHGIMWSN